ncbi:fasciclin domain-containing protein [Novosphingobium sp. 1949]|uniref:Fasciclin domain-containing protein n=1 Tax=Novosphingobium organovorum TaxID=2930092 RepID=A0ABT0BI17_9SPHN|nr:fasciclin domain-containing protein [Novosphingobium organovorum]MCJ2184702.1 fasciclin domain-containing protein [Novosphingobium organovorum]
MRTFLKRTNGALSRRAGFVLALAAGAALAGCSGSEPSADTTTAAADQALVVPADQTVTQLLDNADGLQTVAEALKETGLSGLFKEKGSYTLFAPEDATFEALGDAGKTLTGGDDNAALAALLKEHMMPGYVTVQDLSNAIDESKDGSVTMPSLSGDELTFTKSGDTITIKAPDGSSATIDGEAMAGGESIAIPVTGLLRQVSS